MRNLTTSNDRPCRPTRVCRKITGCPSARTIACADDRKDRHEQDHRHATEDDVDESLRDQAEGAIRAVDERQHLAPVEVLDAAAGQAHRDIVEGDPHDLADLLAQPGDGLDPVQLIGRQADRDLVDDPALEHGLDVVHRPEHGPFAGDQRGATRREVTDDPDPELAVALDAVREAASVLAGADHEHVAQVVAAIAQGMEQGPNRAARRDGQHDLGEEQGQQEQAADIGQLEREQGRERDQPEQDRGAPDVLDLDAGRPPGAQPVQAQDQRSATQVAA